MSFPSVVSLSFSLFSVIAQLTCYKPSNVKSTSLPNFDMTNYGNSFNLKNRKEGKKEKLVLTIHKKKILIRSGWGGGGPEAYARSPPPSFSKNNITLPNKIISSNKSLL